MSYQQMITQRYLQYIVINDMRICLDLKQLFTTFNAVECYGSLVAVPDASISVVVG